MITKIENGEYPYQYLCMNADTMNLPTAVPANSLLYILDTGTLAFYTGSEWMPVGDGEAAPPDDGGNGDGGDDGGNGDDDGGEVQQ